MDLPFDVDGAAPSTSHAFVRGHGGWTAFSNSLFCALRGRAKAYVRSRLKELQADGRLQEEGGTTVDLCLKKLLARQPVTR
jgi:hypothetical protein